MKVFVHDLFGIPYQAWGTDPREGVSCLWAVRQAAARIWKDFDPSEFPLTPGEIETALASYGAGAVWAPTLKVPSGAHVLGDVFYTLNDEQHGCAIVVDDVAHIAFTALPGVGTRCISNKSLRGIVNVYRRRARG